MTKKVTAWIAPLEQFGLTYGMLFIQDKPPICKVKNSNWLGDGYECMLTHWAMLTLGLIDIEKPKRITITIEDDA